MATEELDLRGFITKIFMRRRVIFLWLALFMVLGVIIALIKPEEYTVSTKMIPSTSQPSSLGASFGGLASLTTLNFGSGEQSAEIPPTLYPEVVSSLPFMKELLQLELHSSRFEEPVKYQEYNETVISKTTYVKFKKYTVGLPKWILSGLSQEAKSEQTSSPIREDDLMRISLKEMGAIGSLSEKIALSVDKRSGVITLTASMPEAVMAAEMAKGAQNLLQTAVTDYKILKAQEELEFTEGLIQEKRREFEFAQSELSDYRDKNRNITTASGKNQEQILETKFQLAFNVFNELSQQIEAAKIKVKKDTPAFSVIQPVVVPIERSKPQRAKLVIVVTMIGLFLGIVHVVLSMFWSEVIREWLKSPDEA